MSSFRTILHYLEDNKDAKATRRAWYFKAGYPSSAEPVLKMQRVDENSKMTEDYLYMEKYKNGELQRFPVTLDSGSILANDWMVVRDSLSEEVEESEESEEVEGLEETFDIGDLGKNIYKYKVGAIMEYMNQLGAGVFSHKIEDVKDSKPLGVLLFAKGEYAEKAVEMMEALEMELKD